jgi:hypothetical protein
MCYRSATMAREWTKKIWSRRRRMACAACANGPSNSAAMFQYRVSEAAEPRWSRRCQRRDHLISLKHGTANDRLGTLRLARISSDFARRLPEASAHPPLPATLASKHTATRHRDEGGGLLLTSRNQRRTSARQLRRLDGKLIDHALDARGIGRDLLRAFLQIGVVDIA